MLASARCCSARVTDEKTSFAILDRYVEAGGTFIDTSDNYAFWVDGGQGGQSEELLGRWRRSRGVGDEIVIATKLGARPLAPGTSYADNAEGPVRQGDPRVGRAQPGTARRGASSTCSTRTSRTGPCRSQETVEGFAELVAEGTVGLLGREQPRVWRVERARALAAAAGLPGYEVLQYHHSYLRPAPTCPATSSRTAASGTPAPTAQLPARRARADPGRLLAAAQAARTPGQDKPLPPDYDHPGTPARLAVLREVAEESGATVNQVVLAWQIGGELPGRSRWPGPRRWRNWRRTWPRWTWN